MLIPRSLLTCSIFFFFSSYLFYRRHLSLPSQILFYLHLPVLQPFFLELLLIILSFLNFFQLVLIVYHHLSPSLPFNSFIILCPFFVFFLSFFQSVFSPSCISSPPASLPFLLMSTYTFTVVILSSVYLLSLSFPFDAPFLLLLHHH